MPNAGRKCFGGFIAVAIVYILICGITVTLNKGSVKAGVVESSEWVATSNSWFDRQLCQWVELCGTAHLNSNNWIQDGVKIDPPPVPTPTPTPDPSENWLSGTDDPSSWDDAERERRDIPQYVLDYAPYVHLFSGEQFWPGDLMDHLHHTSPYLNYSKILDLPHDANLTNLDELNDYDGAVHGRFMYLQSEDNVEERPDWLGGDKNIPEAPKAEHPFPDDDDDDVAWPDPDDLLADDRQQHIVAPVVTAQGATRGPSSLPTLAPSPNGRCGGGTGFTCTGSKYGKCCSIYGWCGNGEDYCGEPCEALAGQCNNPFEPRPRPHVDLRRRRIISSSASKPSASSSPSPPKKPSNSTVGRSAAPAILIVVKKPDGIVDAFWFFFYSYNLGQKVFNIRFGNHVGDWEHTMLRFKNGKPQSVFLSEHDFGAAYKYSALEKYLPDPNASPPGSTFLGTWSNTSAATSREAKRPVVYSAVGSHAMYATPGIHPYILPWGLLHDQTDRGPLWDPSLNFQSYVYNTTTRAASASLRTPLAPTQWFDFAGHWGDKFYPLSDPRQYRLAGQYHYVNGPVGPKFKNLGRKSVCQIAAGDVRRERRCRVKGWVGRDEYGRRKFRVGLPDVDDDGDYFEDDEDDVGVPGWSDLDGGLEGNRPGQGVEEGGLPGGNVTDDANVVVGGGGGGGRR